MSLLQIKDLSVRFSTPEAPQSQVAAVDGLNFSLERGQTLGLVGESGSGKSQSMLAVMGLLATNGRAGGQALFDGQDLLTLKPAALNRLRGDRIAMIFQDPMTSLNPYLTVERQMTEVLELHKGLSRKAALKRAIVALESVKIPDAARRIFLYPHEFSGGMRQRVMIAMALLCEPHVLIADEPTTALDVTVQAQIIGLLRELQRDHGTAIVMITHDLGVVAGICDEVLVLYGGRTMEKSRAEDIFYRPTHPYTVGLLGAVPHLSHSDDEALVAIPGAPPNMSNMPAGCAFAPRCALAGDDCVAVRPPLRPADIALTGVTGVTGVRAVAATSVTAVPSGVLRACLRSTETVRTLWSHA